MLTGYPRFIAVFLTTTITVVMIAITALYQYDPLRLFHRTTNEPIRVTSDLRQQAISFIRYADYESVILGTSIFENTSADQASALFGEKFINLSLSGSSYHIRSYPLRKILQNRPIKTVLYSVDFLWGAYAGKLEVDYLYDNNRLNDFEVYLNKKYVRCLLNWSNDDDCRGAATTLDMPKTWKQQQPHMARFGGKKNWAKHKDNSQMARALNNWKTGIELLKQGKTEQIPEKKEQYYIEKITKQLDDSLIHYVKKYPKTQFIAVFPPYFIEIYARWQQSYPFRMRRFLHTIRYLVKQSSKYPNLRIFAFANHNYTDDIANYKDELHYHPDINASMLNDIANNTSQLTEHNVENFIKKLTNRANKFDLIGEFPLTAPQQSR